MTAEDALTPEAGNEASRSERSWMARRVPHLQAWQWAIAGTFGLVVLLWLILAASATSIDKATLLVTSGRHGIAPPGQVWDFGDLPRGAAIDNDLILKNDGKMDTFISIIVTGDLRNFVTVSDAFFNLAPGEERHVRIRLAVPASAEIDKRYNGKAYVVRLPWWKPF
jgi:hypothetical protein